MKFAISGERLGGAFFEGDGALVDFGETRGEFGVGFIGVGLFGGEFSFGVKLAHLEIPHPAFFGLLGLFGEVAQAGEFQSLNAFPPCFINGSDSFFGGGEVGLDLGGMGEGAIFGGFGEFALGAIGGGAIRAKAAEDAFFFGGELAGDFLEIAGEVEGVADGTIGWITHNPS